MLLGRPIETDSDQTEALTENNQCYTMWERASILKISKSIKLLVKMKCVPLILRKKSYSLFGQCNTMRYHLIPVRMASIKTSTNNRCWKGCGEKRTLLPCCWDFKLVHSLWKTVWSPQKNKNRTTVWSSNSLLGIYLKKMKTLIWKDMHTPTLFIAMSFILAKM